jgi:hypothetical protein
MFGNFWVAEQLVASQGGPSSVELVMWMCACAPLFSMKQYGHYSLLGYDIMLSDWEIPTKCCTDGITPQKTAVFIFTAVRSLKSHTIVWCAAGLKGCLMQCNWCNLRNHDRYVCWIHYHNLFIYTSASPKVNFLLRHGLFVESFVTIARGMLS